MPIDAELTGLDVVDVELQRTPAGAIVVVEADNTYVHARLPGLSAPPPAED